MAIIEARSLRYSSSSTFNPHMGKKKKPRNLELWLLADDALNLSKFSGVNSEKCMWLLIISCMSIDETNMIMQAWWLKSVHCQCVICLLCVVVLTSACSAIDKVMPQPCFTSYPTSSSHRDNEIFPPNILKQSGFPFIFFPSRTMDIHSPKPQIVFSYQSSKCGK